MTEEQKAELHRLQKLTVVKLREEVLEKHHDDIIGVSGMNKEQIIAAVCKLKDIPYEEESHKVAHGIDKARIKGDIKKFMGQLKEEGKGKKERAILRGKVKRLKKKLRHAA